MNKSFAALAIAALAVAAPVSANAVGLDDEVSIGARVIAVDDIHTMNSHSDVRMVHDIDVLSNDQLVEISRDQVQVRINSKPELGVARVHADGTVTYEAGLPTRAASEFVARGSDDFTYEVVYAGQVMATGEVHVMINDRGPLLEEENDRAPIFEEE